jgi:hypothetical protein
MISRKNITTALGILLGTFAGTHAWSADTPTLGLTIYSTADPAGFDPQQFISQQRQGYNPMFAWQVPGFGVVRDVRNLSLEQGLNEVAVTDVAQFIDPTTVTLTDLSEGGGVSVLDQTFAFDLVSPQKLLESFLDQTITVNVARGDEVEPVTGKLRSANMGQLVLQTDAGLRVLPGGHDVQLGALPEGFVTKPTLRWRLSSTASGEHKVRTTYQTNGITWRADYGLVLSEDEKTADLSAWVTILNLSGASYPDAQLKLIAGDVQRIQPRDIYPRAAIAMDARAPFDDAAQGFEQKAFFEYHLYTLPRPATIDANSTQQLALFPNKQGVGVEKVLVYYGLPESASWRFVQEPMRDRDVRGSSNPKVDVYVRFDNKEANKLGIPLPKGKMRVYKQDQADGAVECVGEDLIDHTPKNNEVMVKIGQSFDVTGTRTQADFKADYDDAWMEETIEIKLKNAKDVPQKVMVRETLYRWVNWELTEESDEFKKIDSRTVHFEVEVPAEGEKTVRYKVRYTW